MAGPDGPRRVPLDVQQKAAGVVDAPVRTARTKKDSQVHDFPPTSDPQKRLRVPKGVEVDLPEEYIERFLRLGEQWGRRQLEIDRLQSKQDKPSISLKAIGRKTPLRGAVIEPEEDKEGLDILLTPSMSVTVTSEAAFKRGNRTLFQQTTHPEWVFQLTVPDDLMGGNKPITAEMVRSLFEGIAHAWGMSPEDFAERFEMMRNLNEDRGKIREAVKAGVKVRGVKAETSWSLDAKPIPPQPKPST